MKDRIPHAVFADMFDAAIVYVRENYPDVRIFVRENDDERRGNAYGDNMSENMRYIIVDPRKIKQMDFVDTIECMDVMVSVFHEIGHIVEFDDVFKSEEYSDRQISLCALMGRYMPEYKMAIYNENPVEAYAEQYGINSVRSIFKRLFENELTSESNNEPSVDDLLLASLQKYSSILHSHKYDSVDKAVEILDDIIMSDPRDIKPDKKALFAKLFDSNHFKVPSVIAQFWSEPSETRQNFRADKNLVQRWKQAKSRAEQQDVFIGYIIEHPYKDVLLFPNLLRHELSDFDVSKAILPIPVRKNQGVLHREIPFADVRVNINTDSIEY